MNERITEELVHSALRANGYTGASSQISIELQQSQSPKIRKLLANASKKGSGGGYPEFIITSASYPEFIIVIECKANTKYHESKNHDKYDKYAVDGALLYGSYLSKEFDVICIGVSGQDEKTLLVSSFLCIKGSNAPLPLANTKILDIESMYDLCRHHPEKFRQDYCAILDYSKELNSKLHLKKVKESQRSLLISGILIALQNDAFRASYKAHKTGKQLAEALVNTIISELIEAKIPQAKIDNLRIAYSFFLSHPILSTDKKFVIELIGEIDGKINNFSRTHEYFDLLGQFYIEFLRYANSDKGLGIVLTPPHITELFAEIADVDKNSVVLDNCCGTGGFLISAMKRMILSAKGDKRKVSEIKKSQIIGIEFQDDIYALAVSNMIIHGDGKSNIFHVSCFDAIEEIKSKFNPTVGFLNPPYKSEPGDKEELEFILNNLSMLEVNATCVAIIPFSCLISQDESVLKWKRKIYEKHTIDAVMSMPGDLFHNSKVGVVTCIMVIKAHIPHKPTKKTWFGYWRDDGFVKVKNIGRVDSLSKFSGIKEKWLDAYFNRREVLGLSVLQSVKPEDEWCAEAYMETDYSKLTEKDFNEAVRKYAVFKSVQNQSNGE
jgi:type I restriction enzyme M protein